MLNRTLEYHLPSSNTIGLLRGAFADITCSGEDTADILDCQVRLLEECPVSDRGLAATLWCIGDSAEEKDAALCRILRQGNSDESHQDVIPKTSFSLELKPPNTNGDKSCEDEKEGNTLVFIRGGDVEGQPISVLQNLSAEVQVTASISYAHEYVRDRIDDDAEKGCTQSGVPLAACRRRCRAALAENACGCLPWHLSRVRPGGKVCEGQGVGCLAREAVQCRREFHGLCDVRFWYNVLVDSRSFAT